MISPVAAEEVRATVDRLTHLFGEDKRRMLLEIFLSDASTSLQRLQNAISATNRSEVADVSHYLKGACGMLQASYMQLLCSQMEAAAGKEDWDEVKLAYQSLTVLIDLLRSCAGEVAAGNNH